MDEIKGIARVKFHPGKVEEWKRLSEEALEIVRTKDRGTLQCEIFFNEDEARRWCSNGTATPTPRSNTPTSAI
jgi:quinol monooxygenase YgiN